MVAVLGVGRNDLEYMYPFTSFDFTASHWTHIHRCDSS